ncbi:MAG TPA: ferritin-like domain-containing protein [bacterium]|jgi:bacterioferritin|nr:ferritin-like domain-containing protein [bacterium]HPG82446.1 ferritin-like domain-containing protein [bacterium]HPM60215.1 ferritin-like domain-containing protein [bacterium]
MGTKGREIVGMNVDHIIELLNKAFADEWLAYYQYWLGAKVIAGPMKDAVIAELIQHAADELRHADMVANRIIQLGGTPLTTPQQWFKMSTCGYDEPADPFVKMILGQNIKGEQCAISVYNALLQEVGMKDPVTYNMAVQILQDEVMHEEDLQALLEDLNFMLKK